MYKKIHLRGVVVRAGILLPVRVPEVTSGLRDPRACTPRLGAHPRAHADEWMAARAAGECVVERPIDEDLRRSTEGKAVMVSMRRKVEGAGRRQRGGHPGRKKPSLICGPRGRGKKERPVLLRERVSRGDPEAAGADSARRRWRLPLQETRENLEIEREDGFKGLMKVTTNAGSCPIRRRPAILTSIPRMRKEALKAIPDFSA
ncbi:hypothetical protein B0H13DRAFT_1910428 [Mycena leptocephala]|nr:hypothetical protein B0H13DRAFT_1910428 [Mycena leptocephala]